MSSKTVISKKTTVHRESRGSPATPSERRGRSARRSEKRSQRSESPLSPTRISREEEKQELQGLNDRLANYIDTVQRLQNENRNLQYQVEKYEETHSRELTSVRSMFEHELESTRKLLDETSREKSQLQMAVETLEHEKRDFETKKKKLEHSLREKEKALAEAEAKLQDALPKVKRLTEENQELRMENDKLKKRVQELQKKLEDETLKRVDVENQLMTHKEHLDFKIQDYESQIREVRSKKTIEVTEIDGKMRDMEDEYQRKVSEAVMSLREEHEAHLRSSMDEMQDRYEQKLDDLIQYKDSAESDHYRLREELVASRNSSEALSNRVAELEAQNLALQDKLRDLEKKLANVRIEHMDAIRIRDDEIRRLNEEISDNMKEYQELLGIKLSLDAEIATYRKMLEGEERRLNITPGGTPVPSTSAGPSTPHRGARPGKRKRTLMEMEGHEAHQMQSSATSSSTIEIGMDDPEGQEITVINKGKEDMSLMHYVLKRTVGDEVVSYKFGRNAVVKAGGEIKVWSFSTDTNASPENVIMRNKAWIVGDAITTVLSNKEGEEVARRDSSRRHESTSHTIERTGRSSRLEAIELHHQQGDPSSREGCVVM